MSKAFCLDMSGSIQLKGALKTLKSIAGSMEPDDVLILFSDKAGIISVDVAIAMIEYYPVSLFRTLVDLGLGSNPGACLELMKQRGIEYSILISDGYMPQQDIAKFNKFIDIARFYE